MMYNLGILGIGPGLISLLIILAVWDMVWKGIGMWKAGRNNHLAWFICILIFNTVGILPILYIAFFQKAKGLRNKKKKR